MECGSICLGLRVYVSFHPVLSSVFTASYVGAPETSLGKGRPTVARLRELITPNEREALPLLLVRGEASDIRPVQSRAILGSRR